MKKLTIQEKAQAYDKALEKARIWKDKSGMPKDKQGILDDIFPELKENEDERIRKALIDYFDDANKADENPLQSYGVHTDKAIAWLEKQYEKPQGKSALEAINEEKIDNQFCVKPVNKIEPKFHRGQWIIWQDKCYEVNYNGCGYELVDQNGLSTSLEYGTVDTSARLWDVTKDAKDGDVLAEDSCIFIIQKLGDNNTAAKTYYTLYDDGDFDDGSILYFDIDSTKPATKEQRDQLEKVMVAAGYVFDNKELKKIEESPNEVRTTGYCHVEDVGHKTVWSEEDEYCLDGAIETELYMLDVVNGVKTFDVGNESIKEKCTKELNWLKSLKARYTWLPSEEQMDALKGALYDAIWQYDFKGSPIKEEVTRRHAETIESLYNDLKKLRRNKL